MPTYTHMCQDAKCSYIWDESYSMSKDPPTKCPKCEEETAKRVILKAPIVSVELTGQDFVNKIKADANQLKADAANNENLYASLLGEDKYQTLQTSIDKAKTEKSE